MLIGALCLEQVNYDYLTKMDVDNTDRNYSEGNVYTKREHYFDEAYGYVYGLDDDDADDAINNGLLLYKFTEPVKIALAATITPLIWQFIKNK